MATAEIDKTLKEVSQLVSHFIKMPESKMLIDYDREADVLYISIGKPRKAIGVDIGEGAIVRYMEETGEVVGLTLIGVKEKLLKSFKN